MLKSTHKRQPKVHKDKGESDRTDGKKSTITNSKTSIYMFLIET